MAHLPPTTTTCRRLHHRHGFAWLPIACFLCLLHTIQLQAGVVLRRFYENINGDLVSNLTYDFAFPGTPSKTEPVTRFLEKPNSGIDRYGALICGYLEAPQTGPYVFWLASDNDSELWLSTNHLPAGLRKVAENVGHVSPRNYLAKESQHSDPLTLVRAEKYYFELLHKDGLAADHISVGWQLPDGTIERPMPTTYLWPFPVDAFYHPKEKAPFILTEYFGQPLPGLSNITVKAGESATFAVNVEATPPVSIQWFHNNQLIPGANLSNYTLTNAQLINDVDFFRVIVSNRLGVATATASLSVWEDQHPLKALSAFHLGKEIVVVFSMPVNATTATQFSNYTLSQGTIRNATMGDKPNLVRLETTPLKHGEIHTLTIHGVQEKNVAASSIAPFTQIIVEAGLKTHLPFDTAAASNVVADASSHDNFGILLGDPTWESTGVIGGCLTFDGKDDFVQLPAGFTDFSGGLTIALWARPTLAGNWARFIDFANGERRDNILLARQGTSSTLMFEVYHGEAPRHVLAPDALELMKWQHLAACLDSSGQVRIYKNGVLLVEGEIPLPRTLLRQENFLGRSHWAADAFYAGDIDDFRIYERALSAVEIQVLAQRTSFTK